MKRCSACERVLPTADFGRHKGRPDGLNSRCKACAAEKARERYHAHREAELERNRARYRERREAELEAARARYWADPDRARARQREANARYRETPLGRATRASHRRLRRARQKAAECCASAIVEALLGDSCVYCGDPAEHIDHVVPLAAGGRHCAANLVPACARCNLAKRDRSVEHLAARLCADGVEPLIATTDAAYGLLPCLATSPDPD